MTQKKKCEVVKSNELGDQATGPTLANSLRIYFI